MPLIQVRVIKDVFSKEQKRQIINKLTDAMVSIEGEAVRGYTWCLVEEVESGDWGGRRQGSDNRRRARLGTRKSCMRARLRSRHCSAGPSKRSEADAQVRPNRGRPYRSRGRT